MGLFQRGQDWFIDYYVHNRRKREKVGPSKKLAENVLRKRRLQIAENRYLDVNKRVRIRLKDFAPTYLELYAKPNKRSWRGTDFFILKTLNSFFGGRFLDEITPMMIEQFKIQRSKDVTPATTNRDLACLRCMFNKAIAWEYATENPVRKVKFLREDNKRLRFLEKDEIIKLLNCCSQRLKAVVIVALNTGMRKGEISDLKWRDVDFNKGIITLLRTKNGEKRYIPVNNACREALMGVKKDSKSEYIFCNRNGKPYNFRKSFETALRNAGIKEFRFHDLRHTFASQMVMCGIDLNTVRELLGHKDLSLTLRYAHLSADHTAKAVETLGKRLDTFWTPSENYPYDEIFSDGASISDYSTYTSNARLAQLVEQLTLNQWVEGSSPSAGKFFDVLKTSPSDFFSSNNSSKNRHF